MSIIELDLSVYSAAKPGKPVNLLFIHHSVGGQLMADRGSIKGESNILKVHPNGGGLRTLLGQNNYVVHEASNGSEIGEETDICHWSRKFRDQMDRILRTRHQDILFSDTAKNKVVMFQSDSSSNWIEAEGVEPGNPYSKGKTIANYKAAYLSLLQYFRQNPETLFVAVTAPPLVNPDQDSGILWRILGRPNQDPAIEVGKRARAFNKWLKNNNSGWLSKYPLRNVVVFDYYDILTSYGLSNWLKYPSGNGTDSHPTADGNSMAAQDFISFINRAMNRAGKQVSNFYISTPASAVVP